MSSSSSSRVFRPPHHSSHRSVLSKHTAQHVVSGGSVSLLSPLWRRPQVC